MNNNTSLINYLNSDLRIRINSNPNREHGDAKTITGRLISGTNIDPITKKAYTNKLFYPGLFNESNKFEFAIHTHTSGIPFFSFDDIFFFCDMYNRGAIHNINEFIFGAITAEGGMFLRVDDINKFISFSNKFLSQKLLDQVNDLYNEEVFYNSKFDYNNITDHTIRLLRFLKIKIPEYLL